MNKLCGVRIWKGDGNKACQLAGDCVPGCTYGCRVGCFNPARFANPFYGREKETDNFQYWWRYMYAHVEWLCAECYDDMVRTSRYFEEVYRDAGGEFEEDDEFNKILESL